MDEEINFYKNNQNLWCFFVVFVSFLPKLNQIKSNQKLTDDEQKRHAKLFMNLLHKTQKTKNFGNKKVKLGKITENKKKIICIFCKSQFFLWLTF